METATPTLAFTASKPVASKLATFSIFAFFLMVFYINSANAQAVSSKGRIVSGRRVASSAAQSKVDRAKPSRGCNGNFIQGHRLKYDTEAVVMDDNLLQQVYDFGEVKRRASSRHYRIVDDRPLVSVRTMPLDEFNREYNSGTPMTASDGERTLGPLRVRPEGRNHVELRGAVLVVEKRIAPHELYIIGIEYSVQARGSFPQRINFSQTGRCNLKDSYIKAKAKELLAELGIESEWIDTTEVSVNYVN